MDLNTARNILNKNGVSPHEVGRYKAATILGVSPDRAKGILKKLRQSPETISAEIPRQERLETVTETKDKLELDVPKTRIKTLEELINQFQIDLGKWECTKFVATKWEVGMKPPATTEWVEGKPTWVRYEKEPIKEELYSIKATFELIKGWNLELVKREIERLKELAKRDMPEVRKKLNKARTGYCLEISIDDIHIGGLAHAAETGQANWDHKIACKMYYKAFCDLVDRTVINHNVDKILIVFGNDFYHVDNRSGTTERGTVQVCDTRYHKMWTAGFDMFVRCVDYALMFVDDVEVLVCQGNHDRISSWHCGFSLDCLYNRDSRVTVTYGSNPRLYWKWGNTLICFTHGDGVKLDKLPLVAATEARKMFGESIYLEIHSGHIHQDKVLEIQGVKVRAIPSMCPPNEWASGNGWTMNNREAHSFLWHNETGLECINIYRVGAYEE